MPGLFVALQVPSPKAGATHRSIMETAEITHDRTLWMTGNDELLQDTLEHKASERHDEVGWKSCWSKTKDFFWSPRKAQPSRYFFLSLENILKNVHFQSVGFYWSPWLCVNSRPLQFKRWPKSRNKVEQWRTRESIHPLVPGWRHLWAIWQGSKILRGLKQHFDLLLLQTCSLPAHDDKLWLRHVLHVF